jgi:hypothetical protein
MTVHVCASDGQQIGEFNESEFRDKIFASQLPSDSFYWHEGMADWKSISEYRPLAKTQRITIAPPPMRSTIRISSASEVKSDTKMPAAKSQNAMGRFLDRIKSKIGLR